MAHQQAGRTTAVTPIAELPLRGRALCRGFIDSVTIQPPSIPPFFTAIVTDRDKHSPEARNMGPEQGNHRVRLIWLGRRRVAGISAGTELRFEGMVAERDGLPTIFNPRYEIIGKQES
jgi:hypothetical protein